ncbi:MAG TPA: hypothetical protein VLC55_07980 [Burkholderiales bacterium]|nr:hypothetical protein [Burkholderiales bacterium]
MSSSPPFSSDPPSLSPEALEPRLAEFLDPLRATTRSMRPLADRLGGLPREQQEFALRWGAVAAQTHSDLAYQFLASAPQAFAALDHGGVETWLVAAMDAYDRKGLVAAMGVLKGLDAFVAGERRVRQSVSFAEVSGVLELFVRGLSGRPLRLEAGEITHTDTATLFLPAELGTMPDKAQNAALYRATAAHLWAETRFGTFHGDLAQLGALPPGVLAWFGFLEGVRLHACVALELPGLARQLAAFQSPLEPSLGAAVANLASPSAGWRDSLALAHECAPRGAPPGWPYLGTLLPERVIAVREARLARERVAVRKTLAELEHALAPRGGAARLRLERRRDASPWDVVPYELRLQGEALVLPPELSALVASLVQDLGELPPELLVPAGPGDWIPDDRRPAGDGATAPEQGEIAYPEWDFARRHYRKDWCLLRERDLHPGDPEFVSRVLERHAHQVRRIKRSFEALRGVERVVKREPYGDDIDLDALVEARSDLLAGEELTPRLFARRQRVERDIAVMLMVDMSGSTKGWINDAEREALVMLCEALELLGDRYAIYGFSGMTRLRCEIYRLKRFDEPYSDLVRARIAGIIPLDYTRMGAAIRHLTGILDATRARTRLLITLSDGRPEDFSDGYRGEYGIEDTRQALIEAKRRGIHPFCITIDRDARDYLPHMYGAVNWTLVDDVSRLPLKVADIYRRLTC